jgi:predicted dehydrogenase
MKKNSINRRHFIKKSAGLGLVAGMGSVFPFTAKSYSRIWKANERINYGIIGCGGMANAHMDALLDMRSRDNIGIAKVCDIYDKRLQMAAEKTKGKPEKNYQNLLSDSDIDAILIATPEHWHFQMIMESIDAGKHIYSEKPMTHTIEQSKQVVEKMKTAITKLQVGVQGMSDDSYETAHRYILDGALGDVVMAHIDYSRNYAGDDFWAYAVDPDAKPGVNLDWDAWLGPAPKVSWDPLRYFQWRKYWDYSGGIATDLFIHRISRIIKAVGLSFPSRVVASGGLWHYENTKGEIPDTFNMMVDYPEGMTTLVVSSLANDTPIRHLIRGNNATLEFTREGFTITPQEGSTQSVITGTGEVLDQDHVIKHVKSGAEDITLHHRNLLNAIRKGEALKCDQNFAYYGVVACMMGVQSFREKAYLAWDAENEKVVKA